MQSKSKPIFIKKKNNNQNEENFYDVTYEYNKIIIHCPIKSFKIQNNNIISLKYIRNKKIEEVSLNKDYKNFIIEKIGIMQLQPELYFKKKYVY